MSEIIMYTSNLNLPELPAVSRGLGYHMEFLDAVREHAQSHGQPGYDGGYEWTLSRLIAQEIRWRTGRGTMPDDPKQPVGMRLHQGWASGYYQVPLLGTDESLGYMQNMSNRQGGLPAVVFGDHRDEHGRLARFGEYGFTQTSVQLSPEVMAAWETTSPGRYGQIPGRMQEQGITGLVIAPFHFMRSNRHDLADRIDREALFQTIRNEHIPVECAHIEVGRVDLGDIEDRRISLAALRALLRGSETFASTQVGEILGEGYRIWKEQHADDPTAEFPVVTEVTVAGIAAALHRSKRWRWQPEKKALAETHGVLVGHVREFFAKVG